MNDVAAILAVCADPASVAFDGCRLGAWLEAGRLEAGLEPFGEARHVQIGGAKERVAGFYAIKVGKEHVLAVPGTAVKFVDHLDRPQAAEGGVR